MALTMRAELELRRDRQWMVCFTTLVLVLPCISLLFIVGGLMAKSVVVGLALLLTLVGVVTLRCARDLERLLETTLPRPSTRTTPLDG